MPAIYNFPILQGTTFNPTINYSAGDLTVKPVTAITKSARAHVSCTGHNISSKKKVFISGAVGMKQINSRDIARVDKAYTATRIDANTVSLDVDSSEFNSYVSGGELSYHTPVDLTGFTARMQIRSQVDSTVVLASLTTENGGITLGGTTGDITLLLSATATAAFTWDTAVYDLEIVSAGGIVTRILSGRVTVTPEVTR